jgi:hypothetical protein
MLGIIVSILVIGFELLLFSVVLSSARADRDTSLVFKFCSSVWPGVILFTSIAGLVTTSLCWWFGAQF